MTTRHQLSTKLSVMEGQTNMRPSGWDMYIKKLLSVEVSVAGQTNMCPLGMALLQNVFSYVLLTDLFLKTPYYRSNLDQTLRNLRCSLEALPPSMHRKGHKFQRDAYGHTCTDELGYQNSGWKSCVFSQGMGTKEKKRFDEIFLSYMEDILKRRQTIKNYQRVVLFSLTYSVVHSLQHSYI